MLRTTLFLCFVFSFLTTINSQVINWIGGDGNWDDPTNWSTGVLPDNDNSVIIDCDCKVVIEPRIVAFADNVIVHFGSFLGVEYRGELQINSSVGLGLRNEGEFELNGRLVVNGNNSNGTAIFNDGLFSTSTRTDIIIIGANFGIENHRVFISSAEIYIQDVGGLPVNAAIRNMDGGFFYNSSYGSILIEDVSSNGITILQNSLFFNYGEIRLRQGIGETGILNLGSVGNAGHINIESFNESGGSFRSGFKNDSDAFLANTGLVSISSNSATGVGLQNQGGSITNTSTGSIQINGGSDLDHGIKFVGPGKELLNEGEITIDLDGAGSAMYLYSSTLLTNTTTGTITIRGNSAIGIYLFDDFENDGGELIIDKSDGVSCSFQTANLHNFNCGTITINRPLECQFSSVILNEAWLELSGEGLDQFFSYNSGLWNTGVVHDPDHTMANVPTVNFANAGIFIRPPVNPGPYGSGSTIYSPIIVGSGNTVGISRGWIFPDGAFAGSYDHVNNHLYLHYNPLARNYEVMGEFVIDGCDKRYYGVPISGGFYRPAPEAEMTEKSFDMVQSEDVQLFPNPILSEFSLVLPAEMEGDIVMEIRNMAGQVILKQEWEAGGTLQRIIRPANAPPGTYLLQLVDESGQRAQERVIFQ